MTWLELAAQASRDLQAAGISERTAGLDAELLARHVLGWDRAAWLLRRREAAAADQAAAYQQLVARRRAREPLSYIRGLHEFWGREFVVSPSVLIPRPETELLIEEALRQVPADFAGRLIDVGTGTGCVGITLALERPRAQVFATDVSGEAVAVARQNAVRLGAANVTFAHGGYFAGLPAPFDVIVSNPPYVPDVAAPALQPEVKREPSAALFGGADGLGIITELLRQSADYLAPHGKLLMEIGYGQDDEVRSLVEQVSGLSLVRIVHDLQDIPRLVIAEAVSRE